MRAMCPAACTERHAPSGVPEGVPHVVPSGALSGVPNGVPHVVPSGAQSGVPNAVPFCASDAVPYGVLSGMSSGVLNGAPLAVPNIAPHVVPTDAPNGKRRKACAEQCADRHVITVCMSMPYAALHGAKHISLFFFSQRAGRCVCLERLAPTRQVMRLVLCIIGALCVYAVWHAPDGALAEPSNAPACMHRAVCRPARVEWSAGLRVPSSVPGHMHRAAACRALSCVL